MPYCPLKLMASRISKQNTGVSQLSGTYDPRTEECDQHLCGFWANDAEMCGIAAIGLQAVQANPLHPTPPQEEEEDHEGPITNPLVKA